MNKPILSVIIVNYKNERLTIEYVKNELIKIACSYNVIIVNNEATEESDNLIKDSLNAQLIFDVNAPISHDSSCYVIHNKNNDGFARANNIGFLFATKNHHVDYVLFSNNDIHFIDNTVVDSLINKLSTIPEAAMIGPKVQGLDGHLQSPDCYRPFWTSMIWVYFKKLIPLKKRQEFFNLYYSDNAKEGFHYKLMGSFFICKTVDFINCGMMDPGTFLFYEEPIISERLLGIGKKAYYYPKVAVLHDHSVTIRKYASNKKYRRYCFESASYYYMKYHNINKVSIMFARFLNELAIILNK